MRSDYEASTVVYGVVRNADIAAAQTLGVMTSLVRSCSDALAIVATNDNSDGTDQVLLDWSRLSERHIVVRLDGLVRAIPDRVERIAFARNACLLTYRQKVRRDISFLICLDLDGPNVDLDPQQVLDVMSRWQPDWAGVFPNQHPAYYDIYALRHPRWCPGDCWAEVAQAQKQRVRRRTDRLLGRPDPVARYVGARQFAIPRDKGAIQVDSAFGGLAVYTGSSIARIWYTVRDAAGRRCCEHVAFNERIRETGGSLFVLPWLLNSAPIEHVMQGSGQLAPSWLLLDQ